jgi:hypothetical protein
MILQPAALFAFNFFEPLPIRVGMFDVPLLSDAGLLPLRQLERIGLTKQTLSSARARIDANPYAAA